MLDMGFKDDIFKICESIDNSQQPRQTLMFSATFPQDVQDIARHLLQDYVFITVGRPGGANLDIIQKILLLQQCDKRQKLMDILKENREWESFVGFGCVCCFLLGWFSSSLVYVSFEL